MPLFKVAIVCAAMFYASCVAHCQTVPREIELRLDFTVGLPPNLVGLTSKLKTSKVFDSKYRGLLESHKIVGASRRETDSDSYGIFLCEDSLGEYLLVDSYGNGGADGFRRYDPKELTGTTLEFTGVEFLSRNERGSTFATFLDISVDRQGREFTARTNWCRRGRFWFNGHEFSVVLAKIEYPGTKFRIDYDSDYLVIDLDHDGVFDLLDEGNSLKSIFVLKKNKYKIADIDSLGRKLTLRYVGIDSLSLDVGDRCPPFVVRYLDGSIDTSIGKNDGVTLIDFWATWCGPCVAELPGLAELHKKYSEKGLKIVGISGDKSRGDLMSFLERNSIPWRNAYLDDEPNERLARLFRLHYYPRHILIDKQGIFRGGGRKVRGETLEQLIIQLLKNSQ